MAGDRGCLFRRVARRLANVVRALFLIRQNVRKTGQNRLRRECQTIRALLDLVCLDTRTRDMWRTMIFLRNVKRKKHKQEREREKERGEANLTCSIFGWENRSICRAPLRKISVTVSLRFGLCSLSTDLLSKKNIETSWNERKTWTKGERKRRARAWGGSERNRFYDSKLPFDRFWCSRRICAKRSRDRRWPIVCQPRTNFGERSEVGCSVSSRCFSTWRT